MPNLDKYHYHEVTDRAYLLQEIWELQVVEHEVVQADLLLREKAKEINELIGAFYQIAGRLESEV